MEFAQMYAVGGFADRKLSAPDQPRATQPEREAVHEPLTVGQRARWVLAEMVGRSAAMERLFLQMRYLARHLRIALIEGEPGTGKHLTIQTLHGLYAADSTANAPGPAALAIVRASLFLGVSDQELRGTLAEMQGGVLYLTHVDQLGADEQVRLKQVASWLQRQGLQAGARSPSMAASSMSRSSAFPVGSDSPRAVPRALIAGSQRDLKSLVLRGEFRNDLYQQLASVRMLLPPLRDRAEDIPMLVQLFLAQRSRQSGTSTGRCSREALLDLHSYRWPGNLTELRAAVDRAAERAMLRPSDRNVRDLPPYPPGGSEGGSDAVSIQVLAEDFGLSLRTENEATAEWTSRGIGSVADENLGHCHASLERSPDAVIDDSLTVRGRCLSSAAGADSSRRLSSVVAWPTSRTESQGRAVQPEQHRRVADLDNGATVRPRQLMAIQPVSASGRESAATALDPTSQGPATAAQGAPGKSDRRALSSEAAAPPAAPANFNLDLAILAHIHRVLCHANGNKLRAARLLGISRSTLYRLLEEKLPPATGF